jgi:hypothetical protein
MIKKLICRLFGHKFSHSYIMDGYCYYCCLRCQIILQCQIRENLSDDKYLDSYCNSTVDEMIKDATAKVKAKLLNDLAKNT